MNEQNLAGRQARSRTMYKEMSKTAAQSNVRQWKRLRLVARVQGEHWKLSVNGIRLLNGASRLLT
jgi:hypothetical protein